MLLFKTISNKPFFSGSFTQKILSKGTVRFDSKQLTSDYTLHKVDPIEEMRPDLISIL